MSIAEREAELLCIEVFGGKMELSSPSFCWSGLAVKQVEGGREPVTTSGNNFFPCRREELECTEFFL
jgi:hypothetical protein